MKTLDYFEDLSTTFDFVPMSNLIIESTVEQVVQSAADLENEIDKLETRVLAIQKDIETIAELGLRLENEASRKRLQDLAEDFMLETDINEIRARLSELYGARQSTAKALEKLAAIDENINYTCGICLERPVTMFNSDCGHTCCAHCSNKMERCPFCRGRSVFRRLIFSS